MTARSFVAKWSEVSQADSYSLEIVLVRKLKPFVIDTLYVDHIQGTQWEFDNFQAVYCDYRVRAHWGNLHTEWSNAVRVALKDGGSNGIEEVRNNNNGTRPAYGADGLIIDANRRGSRIVIDNGLKVLRK